MSVPYPDCFGNLIGISRNECECDDIPDYASESDSGLYLDELEGLNRQMLGGAADCYAGSPFDVASKAIRSGIQQTSEQILGCIQSKAKIRRDSGSYTIGETKKSLAYLTPSAYQGMKLGVANVRGGYFRVHKIGLFVNQTTSVTVNVYNNLSDDVLDSEVIAAEAGKTVWHTLATPMDLPLHDEQGNWVEYFFLYEPTGGLKGADTKLHCGCGNLVYTPTYDWSKPQFQFIGNKGKFPWADWVMAAGAKGASLSNKEDWASTTSTNGILLNVEFGCDLKTTLCNGTLDYQNSSFALSFASAARYKAGANFLRSLESSPNVNAEALMNGEVRANNIRYYEREYNTIVQELCEQIAKKENLNTYSDCFSCKSSGMGKATIRV